MFIAVCTTLVFVLFLILPIIVYLGNLDNRPVDINELNNINSKCGKSFTSLKLKEKSLIDTTMGFVALGLMYGIIMLTNHKRQDALYFVGLWSFKSIKEVGYWVLTLLVIVGIPTGILLVLLPKVISSPILKYLITVIGTTYGTFAYVYLISVLQNKYGWIEYRTPEEDQEWT